MAKAGTPAALPGPPLAPARRAGSTLGVVKFNLPASDDLLQETMASQTSSIVQPNLLLLTGTGGTSDPVLGC